MNKDELKQLTFNNFTSDELYKFYSELRDLETQRVRDNKPTLESILDKCKEIYIVGSYVKVVPHKYEGDSHWAEYCSTILGSFRNEFNSDVMYAKLTDLCIEEYKDEDGRNDRVVLFYDFVQLAKHKATDEPKLSLTWMNCSKGQGKILFASDRHRDLDDFEFEVITEQEYNEQVELCNKLFKQL